MKTTMKRMCAAAAKAAVALAVALGLVQTAEAAFTWTGAQDGNINTKANYKSYTYSGYYNSDNLTGNKVTAVYLNQNLTGSFKFAGDTTARYRGLQFQKGSDWQLYSNGSTIYQWDNSSGDKTDNANGDKDRITVGGGWKGQKTSGDATLRIHGLKVKLRTMIVGSNVADSPTKGTLILDNKGVDGVSDHGPVTLELVNVSGSGQSGTGSDFFIYNGKVESSEATVTVSGIINMGYSDNANAELAISNGTWKATRMWMSRNNNNTAKLYVSGGLLQMTGSGDNGRINVGSTTGKSINYVEISGGMVDCSSGTAFRLGADGTADSRSELLVNGGTLKCTDFYVGDGSSAKATITSGEIDASAGWVYFARSAGCAADEFCELNLEGGTLTTKKLYYSNGSAPAVLNLSGGTLKAVYDTAEFINDFANLTVNVGTDGAVFDTDGFAITVSEPLNAASGVAGDLTVTGGGSAAFAGMGDLAGALTLEENTGIHWFDQDGAVSATPGFTSLALGAGSTVYLNGDATAVDALPATVTTTATTENKANVAISFSVIPATGSTYTLFPAASADVFNVQPSYAGIPLPCEVAVVDGNLVLTIVAEDYTWNGTGTNWGDADAWTKGGAAATWADGNNAIFSTANATATLAANASPAKIDFTADATVDGAATLTVPSVSVAQGVTATVSAPMAGAVEKKGAGTLALGASRTEQTTVTEGTLKVLSGATVDPAKLTLGTDAAKPVALDYDGETLSTDLSAAANRYMAPGMDVTLTNGVFHTTVNPAFNATTAPNVFTIAKDAVFRSAGNFTWNASYDANVDSDTTVNIFGGQMISQNSGNNNWFMQKSRRGKLRFNVTDGGLFQTAGPTYIMTCRDDTTAADTPEMYMMFSNSTFRVANNMTLSIGYDGSNKNPLEPKFSLAMTSSVLDVGTGIINLGHNVVGANTAGFYTADFVDSVITAKAFKVFHDRPANSARFDNSTLVLSAADSWSIGTHQDFGPPSTPMTIDAGGLTIDTQAFNCNLQADPQGEGAIVKKGSGTLVIQRDQTSSGALNVNEGTLALGESVATLSRPLSFADGTTLDVAGGAPVAITSIALPASGVVTLLKGGSAFAKGVYRIFSGDVAAAAVQGRLVPSTGGEVYSWMVKDGVLLLNVGNLPGNAWTGFAGDGKMSTDANWLDGTAPVAGEAVDFSGVTAAATIEGDIDAALGAVTMGSGIVAFTGDKMKAASFSEMEKVAVGENSTVTVDGDLMLTYVDGADHYAVYKVNDGGKFIVTGRLGLAAGSNCALRPQASPGTGLVVAGSVVNDGTKNIYATLDDNSVTHKWVIGPGGITGTTENNGLWVNANNKVNPEFQPWTNDFTVALWTVLRETAKSWTYNTTGLDGLGHTITLDAGFSDKGVPVYITGLGKVVVNHVTKTFGGKNPYSGEVKVNDTATLAINPGKQLTTGKTTFAAGTTLEVKPVASGDAALLGTLAFTGSGTVTLKAAGDSALADGEYTLFTASSALADTVLSNFTLDASAVSGGRDAWIFRDGASVKLCIGTRTEYHPYGVWTGGMDAKFSTPGNWKNGLVPRVGDALDFSGVGSAKTVNADINVAFGAVTMGSGVVTFTGSLTATSFSDTKKVAVGANSTVTLDGDLEFTGGSGVYIVYKVETGGAFIVTGLITLKSGDLDPQYNNNYSVGGGVIVAGGLRNNGANSIYTSSDRTYQKWIIGPQGIAGNSTGCFWARSHSALKSEFQAYTNDFEIALPIVFRTDVDYITFNTTGWGDSEGHTITFNSGIYDNGTPVNITGKGTVVANHYTTDSYNGNRAPFSGAVNVKDTATLAINAGKRITTGAISFATGTTLALPQTGTVTMYGNLTLAAGATNAYTLGKNDTTLAIASGKTLTLPAEGTVAIAFASGSVYAPGKTYTLISGAGLQAEDLAKFSFPEGESDKFSIDKDGNLVYVAPSYFTIRIADFDVKVPGDWLTGEAGLETCGEGTLASLGANGLPLWKSYCLGLHPMDATSLVLCEPALAQAPSGGEFAVCAKNLSVPAELEGVAVTAYLQRKTANGGWEDVGEGVSVAPGAGPVVLAGTLGEGESVSFFE